MKFNYIPKSLALIPDGNRRWVKAHRLSVFDGYNMGVKKFIDFSEWCMEYGIRNLTVWALSSENVKRSHNEVKALFNIYMQAANDKTLINRLMKNGTRVNIIGNTTLLPKSLARSLTALQDKTRSNTKNVINILIGYGGKYDIFFAAKKLVALSREGKKITLETFKGLLMSAAVPDIDFVIRTSGEKRLSGFMPWQAGYSELYFSNKLWPDFTRKDLYQALADYNKRERRFGK